MKITIELILSVKGTQSFYVLFSPSLPSLNCHCQSNSPPKSNYSYLKFFIAHMTILFGHVTFLAFWKDKSCSRNLELVMNVLQKNFLVRQINLKRYKVTDHWRYFLRKWTCFNRDLSCRFFRTYCLCRTKWKFNDQKWVLRIITWANRGSVFLLLQRHRTTFCALCKLQVFLEHSLTSPFRIREPATTATRTCNFVVSLMIVLSLQRGGDND